MHASSKKQRSGTSAARGANRPDRDGAVGGVPLHVIRSRSLHNLLLATMHDARAEGRTDMLDAYWPELGLCSTHHSLIEATKRVVLSGTFDRAYAACGQCVERSMVDAFGTSCNYQSWCLSSADEAIINARPLIGMHAIRDRFRAHAMLPHHTQERDAMASHDADADANSDGDSESGTDGGAAAASASATATGRADRRPALSSYVKMKLTKAARMLDSGEVASSASRTSARARARSAVGYSAAAPFDAAAEAYDWRAYSALVYDYVRPAVLTPARSQHHAAYMAFLVAYNRDAIVRNPSATRAAMSVWCFEHDVPGHMLPIFDEVRAPDAASAYRSCMHCPLRREAPRVVAPAAGTEAITQLLQCSTACLPSGTAWPA